MLNFLHSFTPNPILIQIGPLTIYWYGLFIVSGILVATLVSFKLSSKYNIKKNTIIDLAFWLIIAGLIGARLYHVMLELPFYLDNPLDIFKVWEGGLAIHGGIIAGLIMIWRFSQKQSINFWLLTAIIAPGMALAQAIGRWGNYFNQEIYGTPTNLPWGIPIEFANRVPEFYNSEYFHPAFLYESLGSLIIFFTLILLHKILLKHKLPAACCLLPAKIIIAVYLILYSLLRFSLEFIRTDITPVFFGLRFPQIISLVIIISISLYFCLYFLKYKRHKARLDKN
ncbi:prolipoprotein diacylglyceryl transferase [Candidatus Parcubacteria bacterium]|nr:prolipoprotein diacylglyceryl transferase [Candidatus Parcubacteria bacterium]